MAASEPLRVIIAGAGFCGLTAAIECKLRGLHPILIEAYSGPSSHGDLLDFTPNASNVFKSWADGSVGKRIWESGVTNAKTLKFFNQDDVLVAAEEWPHGDAVFAGHRGTMHEIVYNYAKEIGVHMRFNKRVARYLDTDRETGVEVEGGEKIPGDVVLACDGPRSLGRAQLLHLSDQKVNSGYAIFRAFFTIDDGLRRNSVIAKLLEEPGEDTVRAWVGPDMHGFIYIWNQGRDCAWVLTHLDDSDIGESWSFPASKPDVHHYLKRASFPQLWHDIVELTPSERIIDYKLVWRAPLETWISKSAKAAVMGDAAHCHLPTSAQGACMAVEDAATVAVCLERCQGDVQLGLRVFERIRYNRSHIIHQASISTRNIYHKNNWTPEFVKANPNSLAIPLFPWITDFEVKRNAEESFDRLAEEVRSGKKGNIQDLALAPGGDYSAMEVNIVEPVC